MEQGENALGSVRSGVCGSACLLSCLNCLTLGQSRRSRSNAKNRVLASLLPCFKVKIKGRGQRLGSTSEVNCADAVDRLLIFLSIGFKYSKVLNTYTVNLLTVSKIYPFPGKPDEFDVHDFHETTEVTFAKLSPEVIRAYIETGEPM